MLLLTTPGADPSAEIADYAATAVGREKFHEVAMGQGQAEKALTLLRDCAINGQCGRRDCTVTTTLSPKQCGGCM